VKEKNIKAGTKAFLNDQRNSITAANKN